MVLTYCMIEPGIDIGIDIGASTLSFNTYEYYVR
jgi:hypothetical protein